MSEGFDGLLPSIKKGNVVNFDPDKGFSIQDLKDLMDSNRRKEYTFMTSDYGRAIFENDQPAIKEHERKRRVARIILYRHFIKTFGIGEAKVVAWLGKHHRAVSDRSWWLNLYGLQYKGIGPDDFESVTMKVIREHDGTYEIQIIAQDYTQTVHHDVLRKGISYKSVINHINYFTKKYKA